MNFLYLHRKLYRKEYIVPSDSINFIEEGFNNVGDKITTIVLKHPVGGQVNIIVDETAEEIYQLLI